MEHVVEGAHRILIFIKGAAADPYRPGRAVHCGLLAGLQQTLGLGTFRKISGMADAPQ